MRNVGNCVGFSRSRVIDFRNHQMVIHVHPSVSTTIWLSLFSPLAKRVDKPTQCKYWQRWHDIRVFFSVSKAEKRKAQRRRWQPWRDIESSFDRIQRRWLKEAFPLSRQQALFHGRWEGFSTGSPSTHFQSNFFLPKMNQKLLWLAKISVVHFRCYKRLCSVPKNAITHIFSLPQRRLKY